MYTYFVYILSGFLGYVNKKIDALVRGGKVECTYVI